MMGLPPPNFPDFDYNPLNMPEYPPRPMTLHHRGNCDCDWDDGFPLNEEPMFKRSFRRRSLDEKELEKASKKFFERAIPFPEDALNAPANMYKNYRPYERKVQPEDYDEEDDDEEPPRRGRERLYVVYRADAFDDNDDEKPSERELESVIRQAIDSTRRRKQQKTNSLDGPAYPRYFYERPGDPEEPARIEFRSLEDKAHNKQDVKPKPAARNGREKFSTSNASEEVKNPGLDQSKWTVIPPASSQRVEEKTDIEEIDSVVNVGGANVKEMKDEKLIKIVEGVKVEDVNDKKTEDKKVVSIVEDVEKVVEKKEADITTQTKTEVTTEKVDQKTP